MCHRKRTPLLIGVVTTLLLVIFVLPIFLGRDAGSPFCPIESALAQEESPCLVQQATISGQEVQILQLQLTNNASQLQILDMQATLASQERILNQLRLTAVALPMRSAPEIITVPVLITTTPVPDPNITPTASTPHTIEENPALQATATALSENCILHVMKDGDTPFGVAELYEANPFDLMEINGLDDKNARLLEQGDILIVPLNGCSLKADEVSRIISFSDVNQINQSDQTSEVDPIVDLPPTVVGSQVDIVRIINAGDISSEGVEIRNTGGVVDLTNWTLEDSDGNIFIFPEQRLFTNGLLTVYTRRGFNTPIALYWGRTEAIFNNENDFLMLSNQDGEVQATYRLSENANE